MGYKQVHKDDFDLLGKWVNTAEHEGMFQVQDIDYKEERLEILRPGDSVTYKVPIHTCYYAE